MLEQMYVLAENVSPQVLQRRELQNSEKGLMHSKQAFRYEVVTVLPKEADSFEKSFDYAKAFATFTAAWIDTDLSGKKTTATALGGRFGFDSASFNNMKLHVSAYTSQKIPLLNPSDGSLNRSYFDENGDSFTYIGESSIDYETDNLFARFGRVKIETPYAQSDDIRMAADTFEGVWGRYITGDDFTLQAYFLSRWAGYDSGDNQQQFKPLFINSEGEKSFGALGWSLSYNFNGDDEASLWYYHVDKMSDIVYGEIAGHFDTDYHLHVEYGVQGSTIQEIDNSGIGGESVGAMAIIDFHDFFIGLAGNYAFVSGDNSITNGFGGGPYYTSLDESTISFVSQQAKGVDVFSRRLGIGTKMGFVGLDELTLELVHGHLESTDNRESYSENDVVFTYDNDKNIEINAIFANYDVLETKNTLDNKRFNRFIVRADLSF